jgi:hypothetical protein
MEILKRYSGYALNGFWNDSIWPWSVPVGLYFLWKSWQTKADEWALVASPLLFPYVNITTWIVLLVVLAARHPLAASIVGLSSFVLPLRFLLPVVGIWLLIVRLRSMLRLKRFSTPADHNWFHPAGQ